MIQIFTKQKHIRRIGGEGVFGVITGKVWGGGGGGDGLI